MASSDMAAHLNHLTDAAHLLAFTAPETSAYLMIQRNGLMLANDFPLSDAQRQHICGACGQIMILGQNSTLKLENEKAVRKKANRSAAGKTRRTETRTGPSKVLTCEGCGRYTKIQLPPPAPISRKKPAAVVSKPEVSKQPPSANASSKKRAKNRKAGLQALLDQSQASRSGAKSGLGLSLSDFMKR